MSEVRNSTVNVGCVPQMVKGELHELRAEQNSQKSEGHSGIFWGEEISMSAVPR